MYGTYDICPLQVSLTDNICKDALCPLRAAPEGFVKLGRDHAIMSVVTSSVIDESAVG